MPTTWSSRCPAGPYPTGTTLIHMCDEGRVDPLASLGYVVVALGNTHESNAVESPGGRMVGTSDPAFCAAGGAPRPP